MALDSICCSLLCHEYVKTLFLSSVDVLWLKKCIHRAEPLLLKQRTFYAGQISLIRPEPEWHLLLSGEKQKRDT